MTAYDTVYLECLPYRANFIIKGVLPEPWEKYSTEFLNFAKLIFNAPGRVFQYTYCVLTVTSSYIKLNKNNQVELEETYQCERLHCYTSKAYNALISSAILQRIEGEPHYFFRLFAKQ